MSSDQLRQQISEGLLFAHARLSENTKSTLEASAFLYSLIELLAEKGLLSIEELDKRKLKVAERLVKKHKDRGVGIVLQDPEYDKYTFTDVAEIDCARYVHLCKAACCRLPFALSKQDIREGIVLWDLGQPYFIAHSQNGYCTHLQQEGRRCTVHHRRPVPCRAYDCRKDKKIWLDFENQTINPDILKSDWPRDLKSDTFRSNST
jgi:Fe-S-cluster containining protein